MIQKYRKNGTNKPEYVPICDCQIRFIFKSPKKSLSVSDKLCTRKKEFVFAWKSRKKNIHAVSQFIDHNNRSAWLISLVSPNRTIKHELRRKQGANKHSKFQIKLTFWRRQSIVLNHLKMILFGCYCQYDCWQSNTQYFFSCFRDHLISFEHFFFVRTIGDSFSVIEYVCGTSKMLT